MQDIKGGEYHAAQKHYILVIIAPALYQPQTEEDFFFSLQRKTLNPQEGVQFMVWLFQKIYRILIKRNSKLLF